MTSLEKAVKHFLLVTVIRWDNLTKTLLALLLSFIQSWVGPLRLDLVRPVRRLGDRPLGIFPSIFSTTTISLSRLSGCPWAMWLNELKTNKQIKKQIVEYGRRLFGYFFLQSMIYATSSSTPYFECVILLFCPLAKMSRTRNRIEKWSILRFVLVSSWIRWRPSYSARFYSKLAHYRFGYLSVSPNFSFATFLIGYHCFRDIKIGR